MQVFLLAISRQGCISLNNLILSFWDRECGLEGWTNSLDYLYSISSFVKFILRTPSYLKNTTYVREKSVVQDKSKLKFIFKFIFFSFRPKVNLVTNSPTRQHWLNGRLKVKSSLRRHIFYKICLHTIFQQVINCFGLKAILISFTL